jgi:hypothetical protein
MHQIPLPPGNSVHTVDTITNAITRRAANPCRYLGDRLDADGLHACLVHGQCTRDSLNNPAPCCLTCDTYTSRDTRTVDDLVAILRSPNQMDGGSVYFEKQTVAVHQIIEEHRASLPPIPGFGVERGIVTSGGGRYWPGTWVMASICREMGWRDVIQAWYLGDAEFDAYWVDELRKLDVLCVNAKDVQAQNPYRILKGFSIKHYAVMHSGIEQPLWMDSDCYPCRDPRILYSCPGYQQTGCVQFPDMAFTNGWTKWTQWGVVPDGSPPIETGQYLFHLPKVWQEAQIAYALNDLNDLVYHWDYGDKGPARVAWAWTKKPRTIYQQLPKWKAPALIHPGPDGEPLFIHRCRGKVQVDGTSFYTPQHSNGLQPADLPAEDLFQDFLGKAREMAANKMPDQPSP